MFQCEKCGTQFSAGAVAVVGLPRPSLCPSCRGRLRRLAERNQAREGRNRQIFWERVVLALMLAAAAVCLWGEWKRTEPFKWIEPAEPIHRAYQEPP